MILQSHLLFFCAYSVVENKRSILLLTGVNISFLHGTLVVLIILCSHCFQAEKDHKPNDTELL